MPTYISLIRWTEKGISSVKDAPARIDDAKRMFQAAGAEMKAFYLVLGQYDMVVVSEARDDETVATLALKSGAMGYISTETLRGVTEGEYRKIVGSLD
jgi:uncharacterized protein with GYD domain